MKKPNRRHPKDKISLWFDSDYDVLRYLRPDGKVYVCDSFQISFMLSCYSANTALFAQDELARDHEFLGYL